MVSLALAQALRSLLPDATETSLLHACLASGDACRGGWDEFGHRRKDLTELFRTDRGDLKRLGPLLYENLRRNDVVVDRRLLTVLRTAHLREELRSKVYLEVLAETLRTLEQESAPTLVVRGAALAAWAYGDAAVRHSHDIDLLLSPPDLDRASSALRRMGFLLREPTSASGRGPITLLHRTSLPVTLSSSLYELSCHPRSWEELWQDGRPATIAGEAARMPSPEDQLAHVLGRASFSPTRVTLQWACDAWKIAARAPTLDADAFVAAAGQSAIVLAASTMLQYLSALGATISSGLLDAAQRRASSATRFERDLALNGLRLGTRNGLSGVLQRMPERRIRLALLWWTVFPSADYVRWAHQPRHSAFIPARYISRALSGMVSMARAR